MSRCNVSGVARRAWSATPLVSVRSASEYAMRTQALETDCVTSARARGEHTQTHHREYTGRAPGGVTSGVTR